MRYTIEIQRLKTDHRYDAAREILWDILHRRIPSESKIDFVFGSQKSPYVVRLLSTFIEKTLPAGRPRLHVQGAPTEIRTKRTELETHPAYQESQLQLLKWNVPDISVLETIYGEYAARVQRVFAMALELGLRRKCGISTTAHLHRVGTLTWKMGIDEGTSRMYSAIGAMHDCIEDLLNRARDTTGNIYGLHRYHEFVEAIIPAKMQRSVVLLTNHYDLILEYARAGLERTERAVSKATLLPFLEEMMRSSSPELRVYVERMHALLSDAEEERDFFPAAKWLLYRERYIRDMALTTEQLGNYRTYEIKALDLTDNAYGRDALAMSGRIKNLIKMDIWARKGYELKSSWGPLNNHIVEMEEDALVHAEHMVIRDFLEESLTLDFIASALLKIRDLSPVFLVDDGTEKAKSFANHLTTDLAANR